jgi:hypothetical protein
VSSASPPKTTPTIVITIEDDTEPPPQNVNPLTGEDIMKILDQPQEKTIPAQNIVLVSVVELQK